MRLPPKIIAASGGHRQTNKYNNTNIMIQSTVFSWAFDHFSCPQLAASNTSNRCRVEGGEIREEAWERDRTEGMVCDNFNVG